MNNPETNVVCNSEVFLTGKLFVPIHILILAWRKIYRVYCALLLTLQTLQEFKWFLLEQLLILLLILLFLHIMAEESLIHSQAGLLPPLFLAPTHQTT